jgi:hypothetical protein
MHGILHLPLQDAHLLAGGHVPEMNATLLYGE